MPTTAPKDFTLYLDGSVTTDRPTSDLGRLRDMLDDRRLLPAWPIPRAAAHLMPPSSVDCSVQFEGKEQWLDQKVWRTLICGCYGGQNCSVTARKGEGVAQLTLKLSCAAYAHSAPPMPLTDWPANIVRLANGTDATRSEYESERRSNAHLIGRLMTQMPLDEPKGLIVISGRTGSRKTTFAMAMLLAFVQRALSANSLRAPHVVTFEDPIETWLAKTPGDAQRYGFDYTPRQKGVDAISLERTVQDALRQAPTALYVGETRETEDWKALLHFAGTGHFAMTTTHAGSLRESMDIVLAASGARTPVERSEVGSRLLALIHLRPVKTDRGTAILPALWVRSRQSLSALTAEGLASLLPHSPTDRHEHGGTFGRTWFAAAAARSVCGDEPPDSDTCRTTTTELESLALRLDLEGV